MVEKVAPLPTNKNYTYTNISKPQTIFKMWLELSCRFAGVISYLLTYLFTEKWSNFNRGAGAPFPPPGSEHCLLPEYEGTSVYEPRGCKV